MATITVTKNSTLLFVQSCWLSHQGWLKRRTLREHNALKSTLRDPFKILAHKCPIPCFLNPISPTSSCYHDILLLSLFPILTHTNCIFPFLLRILKWWMIPRINWIFKPSPVNPIKSEILILLPYFEKLFLHWNVWMHCWANRFFGFSFYKVWGLYFP